MKIHTTFRVGGPASYFVTPETEEEVAKVIEVCTQENVPYYIVGNGSNLLVGDGGYRGAVIQIYKNNVCRYRRRNRDHRTGRCAAFIGGSSSKKMQLLQALSLQAGSRELWEVRL